MPVLCRTGLWGLWTAFGPCAWTRLDWVAERIVPVGDCSLATLGRWLMGSSFHPRNGVSLGTAFENLSRGLGMAYFPAISLSFKESVAFNFGSRPLRYPSRKVLMGYIEAFI